VGNYWLVMAKDSYVITSYSIFTCLSYYFAAKSKIGIFALPLLILLLVQLQAAVAKSTSRIFEKPSTWNADAEETLPAIFKKIAHGPGSRGSQYYPQMVVVHWTVDLNNTRWLFEVFDSPTYGGRTWPTVQVTLKCVFSIPDVRQRVAHRFPSTARSNFCPSYDWFGNYLLSELKQLVVQNAHLTKSSNWSLEELIRYLQAIPKLTMWFGHLISKLSNYPTLGKRKTPDYRTVKTDQEMNSVENFVKIFLTLV